MWRRLLAALTASFAVFGGTYAFGASLSVDTGGLGAGDQMVAACGAGLTFAYTTAFEQTTSDYAISGIDLSNIPAGCRGETVSVTFYGSDHDETGSAIRATLPSSGTTQAIAVDPSLNTIEVGQVRGISVVVS